jgi:hypothetical integral membrane protein (TIGR02206 family)
MKTKYKVIIAAGFIALYGMQVVFFVLLMKPDGVRIHAPVPGLGVPMSTTVVGDAWMKGGAASVVVLTRNAATGETLSVPAERDTIRYRGQVVSVLAAWHANVTFPDAGDWVISARVTAVTDGRTLETAPRTVAAAASNPSHQFVFLSVPHILGLLAVLAWSILVPVLVRRNGSPVVRDRVALAMTLAIWAHEIAYEIYWFRIGAFTVGNCLLFHMCALALMFLPFVYFSKDGKFRQYTFELCFFFGLGGAMQALFTPDIGMHGFPEFKYFAFIFSHGSFVLGAVYAAAVYRLRIRFMSIVRIAIGTISFALIFYGVDRLFPLFPPYELANYFIMGYPPPTGSIIDVFAAIFGPAPWYLAGLILMGIVLVTILTVPYWVGWLIRRRRLRATGA